MNERKSIDIEAAESSFSAYEASKKVVNLLRHCQTIQREDDGAVQLWRIKFYLRNQFPQNQYGRMIVEKHAGQQEEDQKEISVLL